MKPKFFSSLLPSLAVITLAGNVHAADKIYDGGASGTARSWNVGTTWAGDVAPTTGDNVFVGGTALNAGIATLYFGNSYMAFSSNNSAAYSLSPRSITFDNSLDQFPAAGIILRTSSAATTFNATIELTTPDVDAIVLKSDANSAAPVVTIDNRTTAYTTFNLNYSGYTNFNVGNAGTLTMDGANGAAEGMLIGTGGINKTGDGTLALIGNANTFTGGLKIGEGTVSIALASRLGSADVLNDSGVVINGGKLRVTDASISATNRGFRVGAAANSAIEVTDAGETFTINAVIADVTGEAGRIVKTGAGDLELANTNTYTGGLTISAGSVTLGLPDRLGSAAIANQNAVIINGGTLRISGTTAILPSANRGFRVGASTGTIEVIDPAKSINILGTIRNVDSEVGNLVKTGPGTLSISSGTNSFSGTTTVSAGTFLINTDGVSVSPVTVAAGATFGGAGQLAANASISGTLAPGPITAATPGTLGVTGTLSLLQGSTAAFEILDATTADKVTGPTDVSLDGTFVVTLLNAFDPSVGTSFDLIESTNPIVLGPNFSFSLPALTGGKVWDTSAFASTGVISVVSGVVLTPFQTWAQGYFLTGDDALPSGNPDHDPFTNLQEFAFGTNPTTPTGAIVKIEKSGTNALVTYIERNADAIYVVKSGTTLTGWTTAAGITYLGGVDQTGVLTGYTRKQFTSPLGTKEFFRVEAVANP